MSARVRPFVVVASAVLWLALGGTAEASGHCRNLDGRACEVAHHGPLVPIVGAVLAGLAAAGAGVAAATGGVSAAVAAARAAAASAAATLPAPTADATEAPAAEETETAPSDAAAEAPGEVPIDPGELEDWIMNEIARLPIDGAAREEVAEALGDGGAPDEPEAGAPGDVEAADDAEVPGDATAPPGEREAEETEETVDTTPLAPGLGEVRDIGDLASEVADAVDKVGEEIEDLPIDDDAKEAIKDRLGEIGETAGTVRDTAKTAEEYIEALDENLDRTRRMGIDERSRDFLGWFRVTFRAIGQLVEGFVDTAAAPVTGLAGDHADKVEELLHDAVPIGEFGDELGKFPTSAAHHALGASQRNQIEEAQRAWGDTSAPDPDDLRDMYRFPVPPR